MVQNYELVTIKRKMCFFFFFGYFSLNSFVYFRYYFITTEYFLYGESIIYYFKEIVMVDAFLLPFATHHRFISFVLYVIGKLDADGALMLILMYLHP